LFKTTRNAAINTLNKEPAPAHYQGEMMNTKFALLLIWIFVFGTASVSAQTTLRINAGGPSYTDTKGHVWSADRGFNTGTVSSCAPGATVTGTTDPQLYKSARFDQPATPELQYTFAETNGSYTVNLYFAETCGGYASGKRVFDVQLQGATVFPGVDIAKAVGIHHTLIKSANISVTNGQLTIRFVHHLDSPIISAIEILPVASSFTAPVIKTQPGSATVPAGQKASFSVTASGSTPLAYQWQRGGVAISGATTSTYSTPATTSADNGAQLRVVVSNSKGTVTSNAATLTVSSTSVSAPKISTHPVSQETTAGESATFTVAAGGTSPMTYQWLKNGSNISGANSAAYTTPATTAADNDAQFSARVSNSAGSATSNSATLTVTSPTVGVDVTTYHNDNGRTGQNLKESGLTLSNVNSNNFGLRKIVTLDGKVDGQPLFLSNVPISGQGSHNVVYAATEHDSVYALDAVTGAVLWHVSTLANGETTSGTHGCSQVSPEIGITSTPVIDRTRGPHGAIYVVAMSKNSSGSYFQRLYALDITSGAQLFGGPHTITATYPGTGDDSSGGVVKFDPAQYKERAGLLLLGGKIYTTWASHCDIRPYTGWIMSFDANTLAAVSVLNLTPNGDGGALWMSGAAPAADSSGNIYVLDGNGSFDAALNSSGFPSNGNYGNCFCKLSTSSGLKVADYFAVSNTLSESDGDRDLGSGAALVLPDLKDSSGSTWHLALGAGKDGNIYVVNRESMGKFDSNANHVHQQLTGEIAGAWSMAAYYNNAIYYAASGDVLKAFTISNARLSGSPASRGPNTFGYPGATPSISANGTSNGIVWAVGNSSPAVLDAYDATNVSHQLYHSNQAANGRDHFGNGNKYITPTIAEGHVYVGTPTGIAIFGLLP
jgi:hypothetical protein